MVKEVFGNVVVILLAKVICNKNNQKPQETYKAGPKGLLGSSKDMLLERRVLLFLLKVLSTFEKPKVWRKYFHNIIYLLTIYFHEMWLKHH